MAIIFVIIQFYISFKYYLFFFNPLLCDKVVNTYEIIVVLIILIIGYLSVLYLLIKKQIIKRDIWYVIPIKSDIFIIKYIEFYKYNFIIYLNYIFFLLECFYFKWESCDIDNNNCLYWIIFVYIVLYPLLFVYYLWKNIRSRHN
mgnify:CR=1 FL=1